MYTFLVKCSIPIFCYLFDVDFRDSEVLLKFSATFIWCEVNAQLSDKQKFWLIPFSEFIEIFKPLCGDFH